MINVGIIGYGKMGQIRHQVISSIKNAQVKSVYDPANIITEIEKVQSPDQIIKNPKIKNTPSILERFKSIKKSQYFPKSQNLGYFDDFGGRSVRGLGVNHFLKNLYLRVTDGMKSENLRDFL